MYISMTSSSTCSKYMYVVLKILDVYVTSIVIIEKLTLSITLNNNIFIYIYIFTKIKSCGNERSSRSKIRRTYQ